MIRSDDVGAHIRAPSRQRLYRMHGNLPALMTSGIVGAHAWCHQQEPTDSTADSAGRRCILRGAVDATIAVEMGLIPST